MGSILAPVHKLSGIQYLRAIAALMVVYYHLGTVIPDYTPELEHIGIDVDRLPTGVDIFFLISGFIMVVVSRNNTPGSFFLQRLIRVAPLYWILTGLLAFGALLVSQILKDPLTWQSVIKSFLFIPYLNNGHGGQFQPVLVPGWTLNYEMFFYALFALAMLLPHSSRVIAVGIVLTVLVILGFSFVDSHSVWSFYTRPVILDFWIGMVIAYGYLGKALKISRSMALGLIGGGFLTLLLPFWQDSYMSLTLPCVAIVTGTASLEQRGQMPFIWWLSLLGDASYSIYLTHIFTLGVVRAVWLKMGGTNAGIFALIAILAVLAVSLMVHWYVEVPLTARLRRRLI